MADYVKMWTPDEGQTFIDGDYTYTVQANSTLSVKVTSTDKATYGQIKDELIINGETYTTTSMDGCFEGCSNLTTAPIIPAGITLMQSCFKGCTKLSGNIVALNSTISSYTDIFTNTDVARKIFIVHSTEVPDTSADIVVWQTIAGNFSNVYYKAESNPDPTNEVRVERGTYDENEGTWSSDDTENDIKVVITAGLSTEFLPINWTNEIKSYSVTFENASVTLIDAQINGAMVTGYILNEENAGTIRTTVTDSYNRTSNGASAEVYNIFVMLDFYPGGEGMAIGKASERNGLDIKIPTTIGEGLKPPTKIENGKEIVDLTKYQLTIGKYNKKNDNAFLIVGGGTEDNDRRNVLELDSAGLRLYAYDGGTQFANIGYGKGQAASGTDIAPYYTLGIRKTTNSQYNENATYDIGDICIYDEEIYICVTPISIPEPWTSIHWQNYLGNYSIAEGNDTIASGYESHAEGASTKAVGNASHAEGKSTIAVGKYSHAQNLGTIAQRRSQTTIGEYNITDTGGSSIATRGDYAFIIGNGNGILDDPNERSNALSVDWSGNVVAAGGYYSNSMLGFIQMFAGAGSQTITDGVATTTNLPPGWLLCDGSSLLISEYPDLAAIFWDGSQYIYGSVDSTHFNLPDLRGRFPLGAGSGYSLNNPGGNKDAIVPYHTHIAKGGAVGNNPSAFNTNSSGSCTITSSGGHTHTVNSKYTENRLQSGTNRTQYYSSGTETGTAMATIASNTGAHTHSVPNHTHSIPANSHTHSFTQPTIDPPTGTTSGNTTNANMPPYIGINFIIYAGI